MNQFTILERIKKGLLLAKQTFLKLHTIFIECLLEYGAFFWDYQDHW